MSDQPTEYPRFYGFTHKKRHFIWRPPEEVEPASAELSAGGEVECAGTERFADSEAEGAYPEALAIGEAEAAPIVAVEPQPEPDRTPTDPQPVIDATIVSPEIHQAEDSPEPAELLASADILGPTTDATALAITNVASLCTKTGLPSPRQVELGRSVFAGGGPARRSSSVGGVEYVSTELSTSAEAEESEVHCLESGGLHPSPDTGPEESIVADVLGTTTDATASATINVASPPVNSGDQLSRNSRASKKSPARRKTKADQPVSSLAKHEAKCMICRSKWREEIDELFVNWHNVSSIGREYHTPRRVIYRHANAVGLFPIRDRNVRCALGLIIHRAENAPDVTADSVIRAVRTLAHINDAGEWTNPPTHVIVSSGMALRSNNAVPSPPQLIDTPCQSNKALNP